MQVLGRNSTKIGFLRIELSKQTVRVFIASSLMRAVRVSEKKNQSQILLNRIVTGELASAVCCSSFECAFLVFVFFHIVFFLFFDVFLYGILGHIPYRSYINIGTFFIYMPASAYSVLPRVPRGLSLLFMGGGILEFGQSKTALLQMLTYRTPLSARGFR